LPLSARARIEVYLPDVPKLAYHDLLFALEREFCYTFGGVTTVRGIDGRYLSLAGAPVYDRVTLIYSDIPFSLNRQKSIIARYADELRGAAFSALDEEAVLVAIIPLYHVV
jgi:hypothetical protein